VHNIEYLPFYQGAGFSVQSVSRAGRRNPRITINDECLFVALRLAKSGYYNGDPDNVLKAPVSMVQNILHYENFEADLKNAYMELDNESR
jgi:hypothetical protein